MTDDPNQPEEASGPSWPDASVPAEPDEPIIEADANEAAATERSLHLQADADGEPSVVPEPGAWEPPAAWSAHAHNDPTDPAYPWVDADEPAVARGRRRAAWVLLVAGVGLLAATIAGFDAFDLGGRGRVGLPDADYVLTATSITQPAYDDAFRAAGCRVLASRAPRADRRHFGDDAPPADVAYAGAVRPAHSGRHLSRWIDEDDVVAGFGTFDERQLVHNLEHGAVVVWVAESRMPGVEVDSVRAWGAALDRAGLSTSPGVGVFVARTDDDLDDVGAIALRAWGEAVDCREFSEVVANGFVAAHIGDHGCAPEIFETSIDNIIEQTGAWERSPCSDVEDLPDGESTLLAAPRR